MKRNTLPAIAVALSAAGLCQAEDPRYYCVIEPSAVCDEQVPEPIISDLNVPTQNSFGPFVCSQFWGQGVMSGSSFSSYGIVGVDLENAWNGCASFGCGPNLLILSVTATHEFEVVFTSPTDDPIDVRMNLYYTGNIQEASLYRVINTRVTGPGAFFTGQFGQINDPDSPEFAIGLLTGFDEITGLYTSTPAMTVPTNTPVRFTMTMFVENAGTTVEGGAVNFARGMRLQSTPFTVTGTAPGVSPDDIVIDSPGANISGGVYGGADCYASDLDASGQVDLGDLNLILANFGNTGGPGDTNGDGEVNLADLNLVLANFGSDCSGN
ncbi:MAG: hypothetical protein ACF8MJ_10425 [Phycisphaerales bacterium JB050]